MDTSGSGATCTLARLLPDEAAFNLHDLPGLPSSEAYPQLVEDAQGRILTPQGPSLGLWDKGDWRMVTERNGLSRFEIQELFVDREGSVWIGVVGHGLKRWVGQDRWEGYTAADGLSDDLVWASMRDRRAELWIGTESGLDWIPPGQPNPKIWQQAGIMTERAGALEVSRGWSDLGGQHAGALVRIDPNSLVGRSGNFPKFTAYLSTTSKTMWAATDSGLYKLDPTGRIMHPRLVEDAAFANTRSAFELCLDAQGRHLGRRGQGLFLRDEQGLARASIRHVGRQT